MQHLLKPATWKLHRQRNVDVLETLLKQRSKNLQIVEDDSRNGASKVGSESAHERLVSGTALNELLEHLGARGVLGEPVGLAETVVVA